MDETDTIPPATVAEIREWMTPIDAALTEAGVQAPDRVRAAAEIFVGHCILEIEGETKEKYYLRPWFRRLCGVVRGWYVEQYGASLNRPNEVLVGVCEIRGSLFEAHIPTSLGRPEEPGKTAWFVMPVDLQDGEDPSEWLVNPPNLTKFESQAKQEALDEVCAVGGWLRSIHHDIMTATIPDDEAQGLADNVLPYLQTAAQHLTHPYKPAIGLACWDAHQAVEQLLKLAARQHLGTHAWTHDLTRLFEQVRNQVNGVDEALLGVMPDAKRIVQMRAGEGRPVSRQDAYRLYRRALDLAAQCARALSRNLEMRNSSFLIRKAPWA